MFARDDLPGHATFQPRGRGLARLVEAALRTRTDATKTTGPQRSRRWQPVPVGHGQHRRATRRGRRPGHPRALRRRPDHRFRQRIGDGPWSSATTGFVMLLQPPTAIAFTATLADAMTARSPTSPILRGSLTWDQGAEDGAATDHRGHRVTNLLLQPAGPWQPGTNENTNSFCAGTSPRAPTCPSTAPASSTTSPPTSTPTPQTPQMAHPRRRARPTSLRPVHIRCSDRLNSRPIGRRRLHTRRSGAPARGQHRVENAGNERALPVS